MRQASKAKAPGPPRVPEVVVVLAVVALLLALFVGQVSETIARARAVEWFPQSGPLRAAMHEHYAIHGDWTLAEDATDSERKPATRCAYADQQIHCRLDGKRAAKLVLQPVATAGSVNWACARPADGDAAAQAGARWFHVCRPRLPFQQAASISEER